jgi:hypothetical protein
MTDTVDGAGTDRGRALTGDALAAILLAFAPLAGRGHNLSTAQVVRVAREVFARAPCRLLVFGAGDDTRLWALLNAGGRTVVLEDQPDWLEAGRQAVEGLAGAACLPVQYASQLGVPMPCPAPPEGLPDGLLAEPWDVILVDGPFAYKAGPGREQSIHAAALARAAHPSATVFVHDYDRAWERRCCDVSLGPPAEVLTEGPRALAVWRGGGE